MMAKAIATEVGLNFLAVKGPEVEREEGEGKREGKLMITFHLHTHTPLISPLLSFSLFSLSLLSFSLFTSKLFSKWVGESEKAVREIFRKARAGACVPSLPLSPENSISFSLSLSLSLSLPKISLSPSLSLSLPQPLRRSSSSMRSTPSQ